MKSLRKVMSIVLTIAMMFTLLIPATFVSAEVAPAIALSVVDASGNEVAILSPGATAYLRISVSGLEQLFKGAFKISATGAAFGTNKDAVKDLITTNDAFLSGGAKVLELNKANGMTLATDVVSLQLGKSLTAPVNPPLSQLVNLTSLIFLSQ